MRTDLRSHADVADLERRLRRRGDRAEAAVTLLFAVFLSVILTVSIVHWFEVGAADLAAEAPAARTGGAS